MKQILSLAFAFVLTFSVQAQINTPQPSPFSKVEQKVGLTDVTLEYSRPSARDRKVFGNLVPFGKLWRAGANKNTIISFSDDVQVDGKTLKAGDYAVFITPNKGTWTIMFYTDTNNWGTPAKVDPAKVAAEVSVKTENMPMMVQTWTMTFDNLTNNSAELGFIWENTYAGVTFTVPTDNKVTADIERVMNGPSGNDYYAAAVYYSTEGKDLKKAEEWMDKAMEMTKNPGFWQYRQQSLLYAKLGNKKAAIAAAKLSLEGAKARGNADYIKMNTDSLKEWGAL